MLFGGCVSLLALNSCVRTMMNFISIILDKGFKKLFWYIISEYFMLFYLGNLIQNFYLGPRHACLHLHQQF